MKDYLIQGETLRDIADAIREKTGSSEPMEVKDMADNIDSIGTGIELPTLNNEGTAADMLAGKQLISGESSVVTGTIPTKTSSDLIASGATVTVPAGYYASNASKSVATATQATPSVSIDANGKITASATQTAGYVAAGTKSGTKQLTTQAAKTITPSTNAQTAVAKNVYTTGAVTVEAIPSNYEDVTEETGELVEKINSLEESLNLLNEELNGKTASGGSSGGGVELVTFKYEGSSIVEPTSRIIYLDENMSVQIVEFDISKTYTSIKNSICIVEGITDNGFDKTKLIETLGTIGVYQVTGLIYNDGGTDEDDEDDEIIDTPFPWS